ncbi:hypothetical protein ACFL0V_01200 [Nanoarchaeota archaeon]
MKLILSVIFCMIISITAVYAVPTYTITQHEGAPHIDGLKDVYWNDVDIGTFEQVAYWMSYDDEYLYFLVWMVDDGSFANSAIMVLIDDEATGRETIIVPGPFHDYTISWSGSTYELNPTDVWYGAANQLTNGWYAEFKIRRSDLDLPLGSTKDMRFGIRGQDSTLNAYYDGPISSMNYSRPVTWPLLVPSEGSWGEARNNPPVLEDGNVDPLTGEDGTEFTFEVKYLDADLEPPEYVMVTVWNDTDGIDYDMEPITPGCDLAVGCGYRTQQSIGAGNYWFRFSAHDGTHMGWLPPTGGPGFELNISEVVPSPIELDNETEIEEIIIPIVEDEPEPELFIEPEVVSEPVIEEPQDDIEPIIEEEAPEKKDIEPIIEKAAPEKKDTEPAPEEPEGMDLTDLLLIILIVVIVIGLMIMIFLRFRKK